MGIGPPEARVCWNSKASGSGLQRSGALPTATTTAHLWSVEGGPNRSRDNQEAAGERVCCGSGLGAPPGILLCGITDAKGKDAEDGRVVDRRRRGEPRCCPDLNGGSLPLLWDLREPVGGVRSRLDLDGSLETGLPP
ncbi:hypothetical protein MLD38_006720 [Melastoma candidum]|uniref:Uncharacterized protein n=1 Tax=Melastoma candidum TaxID=119954 RepID=A0ACB9RX94_9MYRT|nr:hypothetical protein MLD38_006720 [Melastoma candidum]